MEFTLRQLQRMLSASVKNPGALLGPGRPELARLAQLMAGAEFNKAAVKNGCIVNGCDCRACRQNMAQTVTGVQPVIDSLCRQYGPNTPVEQVLNELSRRGPQSGNQQSGESDESDNAESAQDGQSGSGGAGRATDPSAKPDPRDAEKAREAADSWQEAEARRQRMEERARQEAAAEAARRAEEAKAAAAKLAAAKQAVKAAKSGKPSARSLSFAQRDLKSARRAVSMTPAVMGCGPSLEARRAISAANGRLRRVPAKLRARMAELINRLVSTSGAAGGVASTIPVYDSRKLVKRMLVKRPLPNALKEDAVTGRPVTLFLPDVSPSCATQAQDACDVANAAGYAGVSGSDVLVLPHSNGCVSEYEDSYTPWFNGRPVALRKAEWERLFTQIVEGRSRYRIRVVVAVGDHDAVEMYQQLVALKSVLRLVWLHNDVVDGIREPHVARTPDEYLGWSQDLTRKTTLVWSCANQRQMVRGLDLALQNR